MPVLQAFIQNKFSPNLLCIKINTTCKYFNFCASCLKLESLFKLTKLANFCLYGFENLLLNKCFLNGAIADVCFCSLKWFKKMMICRCFVFGS